MVWCGVRSLISTLLLFGLGLGVAYIYVVHTRACIRTHMYTPHADTKHTHTSIQASAYSAETNTALTNTLTDYKQRL